MSYGGQAFLIPLGVQGLITDESPSRIPFGALISAKNISYEAGALEKEPGSRRWNTAALPAAIDAIYDFWPNEVQQFTFVVLRNGSVYRMPDQFTQQLVTPAPGSFAGPTALVRGASKPVMVTGGAEVPQAARKLFIFTGQNPVQVVSGTSATRTNIAGPTADWEKSYPTFGIVHHGRMCALGNESDPHRLYLSDPENHEEFTTNGLQFSVYPGEGEKLISGHVYLGRLYLFKYPNGVYFLDDADPNSANWAIRKLTDGFSVASPQSAVTVLNDLWVKNATGSITSFQQTNKFGDVESGDLLRLLQNESYMRNTTSPLGTKNSHGIYYEAKKRAYFTYQGAGSTRNDRMLVLDLGTQDTTKTSWNTKDQANCLALRKDSLSVRRPIYGADDGYIYEMDWATREIAGQGYRAEFITPQLDFGQSDAGLAERVKLYDFLELTFEETGGFNLSVEVFIDGRFSETLQFKLSKNEYMDDGGLKLDDVFERGVIGRNPQSVRLPLHGSGRRIAFKCYNDGLRENFRACSLGVYFRMAAQEQRP